MADAFLDYTVEIELDIRRDLMVKCSRSWCYGGDKLRWKRGHLLCGIWVYEGVQSGHDSGEMSPKNELFAIYLSLTCVMNVTVMIDNR